MKVAVTPKLPAAYAGFWRRLLAFGLDLLVADLSVFALSYGLGWVEARLGVNPNRILLTGYLVGLLFPWLYWSLFESSSLQATPGKWLLRLVVTDISGGRLRFKQATQRNICKILSIVPAFAGFVAAAFTPRKQALHDLVTGCLVVRRQVPQGNRSVPSTIVLTK
ncbi:RDD family protein [Gloeobacter kilaueensis]|uniref:RDD domain-containing protein n=1 Tax=Gloeobacter kilaueensis (strain ATCC BAA-2537 / CCAP 1431/1 / ULC 316 / JS1) TaxID=1183438 RepID=U5QMQ8_GLOK1|nr:RDD family protein [Gloeobacter kilaueensis]AGY58940.1 hypothetical protein GKIL_2694 [Gloeobacter kilaueensis JS1]